MRYVALLKTTRRKQRGLFHSRERSGSLKALLPGDVSSVVLDSNLMRINPIQLQISDQQGVCVISG